MQLDYSPQSLHRRSGPFVRWLAIVILAATAGYVGTLAVGGLTGVHFTVTNGIRIERGTPTDTGQKVIKINDDPEYTMPENSKDRLDILILGIRGKEDMENGGLLTDTILLFSLDKKTGVATLSSLPRDMEVRITDTRKGKINEVYAHYGLGGTRKLFSRIIGVYVDNIIVGDFIAFKDIVDQLGGVAVTLDKPFSEPTQWGNEFVLPAGENTLTGDQALYYVRSRYSSSDFDRSRRQMQVLMAIKTKASALSLLENPIQALNVVTAIRKHIETDLDILDLGTIKDLLASSNDIERIRRYQLTTENLLYETKVNGIYELLPRGDTLAPIKEFFRTVLTDKPALTVPTPTPSTTPTRTP